jgi:Core-2/I-Branching enzyme
MQIAYLILAHNRPDHLERLINALQEDWTSFFIHVDKKSKIRTFDTIRALPRTFLIEDRVSACWAGFSLVQAALNMIDAAIRSTPEPDWYVLMSGSDYPIRSNREIHDFLAQSTQEHINLVDLPSPETRKPLEWLEMFQFEGSRGRPMPKRVFLHQLNRLLVKYYKRDFRPILGDMRPYAGSQWWVLSKEAIRYVVEFTRTHPKFVKFFRHVHIPDEMYFQIILGNSQFRQKIARNFTYTDFSRRGARPAMITAKHLEMFADPDFRLDDAEGAGPCFFARKFDASDHVLLDRVDEIRKSISSTGWMNAER